MHTASTFPAQFFFNGSYPSNVSGRKCDRKEEPKETALLINYVLIPLLYKFSKKIYDHANTWAELIQGPGRDQCNRGV
jgi:hypothetical protein